MEGVRSRLTELDLSENEADVYVALLEAGRSKLSDLNDAVDMARSSIYNNLGYLAEKGLVTEAEHDGVTHYEAATPEQVKTRFEEKLAVADSVIPSLKQLEEKDHDSSSVQVFEGKTGVSSILAKVFASDGLKRYFGSYTLSEKALEFRPEHFAARRIDEGIPAEIVVDEFDESRRHDDAYRELTDLKVLSDLKQFPGMCFIWDDCVAVYTLRSEISGAVLRGSAYQEMYKFLFDTFWDEADQVI